MKYIIIILLCIVGVTIHEFAHFKPIRGVNWEIEGKTLFIEDSTFEARKVVEWSEIGWIVETVKGTIICYKDSTAKKLY